MAVVSMKQLLEAGVHFGHQTRRWNPKMAPYIYTERNGIYIIDLQKTVKKLEEAYAFVRDLSANGGNVLFVGTKKQAQDAIKEEATRCGGYYVNARWLGGMLTNFRTMRTRIDRLAQLRKMEEDGTFAMLPKKEVIKHQAEIEKLEKYLGGVKEMKKLPAALFIVDPRKERNAIAEARKLNIPIVAIVDTNCDPDEIDYVIPGNDDAIRAIRLIASAMASAAIEGRQGEDAAVDWLREKGLAKAAKKADRIAAEGVAYATVVNGIGVVIEVNSETDFAAKTDAFMDLVKNLAVVVATENPADVDALKACKYPNSNLTVTEIMQEKVMSIGENMQIRRFARFADNTSVAYVHAGGTHGVLVNLAVEGGIDATEIGKNVAMQIAAMSPKYWDKSQVPQADVDKELAVQVALMDNDPKMASKPAAVKEKIAAGKMAAFYKESCLLQQEFVRSDLYKGDVAGYIADAAKKLGGKVTFVDAVHYVKGEGIEKKADDFAAEVAAQIAGAQK